MKKLGYRLYCRNCGELVEVYECHRREKAIPEIKPEYDMITWCCVSCSEPVIEVTEVHTQKTT